MNRYLFSQPKLEPKPKAKKKKPKAKPKPKKVKRKRNPDSDGFTINLDQIAYEARLLQREYQMNYYLREWERREAYLASLERKSNR